MQLGRRRTDQGQYMAGHHMHITHRRPRCGYYWQTMFYVSIKLRSTANTRCTNKLFKPH